MVKSRFCANPRRSIASWLLYLSELPRTDKACDPWLQLLKANCVQTNAPQISLGSSGWCWWSSVWRIDKICQSLISLLYIWKKHVVKSLAWLWRAFDSLWCFTARVKGCRGVSHPLSSAAKGPQEAINRWTCLRQPWTQRWGRNLVDLCRFLQVGLMFQTSVLHSNNIAVPHNYLMLLTSQLRSIKIACVTWLYHSTNRAEAEIWIWM